MRPTALGAIALASVLFGSSQYVAGLSNSHCDTFMCNADGSTYNFQWVIDTSANTLNATIQAPADGEGTWVAVGFSQGTTDPMAGGSSESTFSDMVIGSYSSTTGFVVRDYHTSTKTTPTLDSSQDVYLSAHNCAYDADNNTVTIGFWRYLDTGDSADDKAISIATNNSATILWAFNPYAGAISSDGVTLSKHDATARGFVPGYSFSSDPAVASACDACSAAASSVYDDRVASCVSNGWPAVDDLGSVANDVVTFTMTVTCSICESAKLTDKSVGYVSDTLLEGLESQLSDATLTVAISNVTDVVPSPSASPTVSMTVTVTADAGNGAAVKDVIETEFNDNNGDNIVDLLNSGQTATTVEGSALVSPVSVVEGTGAAVECLSNDDGSWTASWEVDNDAESISFTLTSTVSGADGWVGIGFHNPDDFPVTSMGPGDFYIGSVATGVIDYNVASGNGQPSLDTQDDVFSGSTCSFDDSTGSLQCSFERSLQTSDSDDVDIIAGTELGVLFAASDSAFPAIHTVRGAAASAIDLTEECSGATAESEPRTLVIIHAVLMVIAWILLLPWGAMIARLRSVSGWNSTSNPYTTAPTTAGVRTEVSVEEGGRDAAANANETQASGKSGPALWFRFHEPVQWIGVVLMIISLVIIVVDAGVLNAAVIEASTTSGAHQIVGIIVATLAISQPVFAFCRNGCGDITKEQSKAAHDTWHKVHAVSGILSLLTSLAALILGMFEFSRGTPNPVFVAGIVVFAVTMIGGGCAGGALQAKGKKKHSNNLNAKAANNSAKEETSGTNATNVTKCGRTLPIILFVGELIACGLCIGGIFRAAEVDDTSSGIVTDAVSGEYMFCNYMPGYAVTTEETQYYCHAFEYPDVDDQQVINYKVLLDQDRVVHHMILYSSDDADPAAGFFDCSTMPPGSEPMWAWAPGSDEFVLPPNVGFDTPKYGILQVHYNNPNGLSGLVDRSGVLMNITSTAREYSAGFFITGISTGQIEVPPEKNAYGLAGVRQQIPSSLNGKIVFSSVLHMHLIGKRIWTRLWRDGEVLIDPDTGTDALGHKDAYDYNFQSFDTRSVTFQSGDELQTTCIYENTVQRGIDFGNPRAAAGLSVSGGESTQEEMCLSFVAYYPATSASGMVSPQVVCDDDDALLIDCSDYN